MPELRLHFKAGEGADLEAAAAALQKNLTEVRGVESADTRPQRFQSIGPAEIVSVIHVATSLVQNATLLLTALAGFHAAWEKLKPAHPGVEAPKAEVGLELVPVKQITPEHQKELVEELE